MTVYTFHGVRRFYQQGTKPCFLQSMGFRFEKWFRSGNWDSGIVIFFLLGKQFSVSCYSCFLFITDVKQLSSWLPMYFASKSHNPLFTLRKTTCESSPLGCSFTHADLGLLDSGSQALPPGQHITICVDRL